MTAADQIRADYRRDLAEFGSTVTVRRGPTIATALARVMGWTPGEVASGLDQGERKVILLAEDLERAGFPEPIRKGDGIFVRGARLNVEAVDDSTRRIGDVLIAYELGVKGG